MILTAKIHLVAHIPTYRLVSNTTRELSRGNRSLFNLAGARLMKHHAAIETVQ